MNQLTVVIPCKDERRHIRACVASVMGIADEVLVADSGSSDGTRALAREMGCRVIEREYRTSGDFKNWAIPQATHPWILLLDADERLTGPLEREIRALLRQGPGCDGYWIRRDNHFLGHAVRYGGWSSDRVLRFFRRDLGRYEGPSDHGEVRIGTGNVGHLKGRLEHYTYASYSQCLRKMERYTGLQAEQWHQQGRAPRLADAAARSAAIFPRLHLAGWISGRSARDPDRLAERVLSFLKQARLWEAHCAIHDVGEGSTLPSLVSEFGNAPWREFRDEEAATSDRA